MPPVYQEVETPYGDFSVWGSFGQGFVWTLGQAFLDGYWSVGDDTIVGANLGRVEIPFGLYNRTRDRVDTRPSIVLPQSIYLEGLGLRNYILNGDGGMGYALHELTDKSRLESRVAVVYPSFGEVAGLDEEPLFSGRT